MRRTLIFLLAFFFSGNLFSQLSVSPYFSDDMVFQRNAVNTLSGKAVPGERIHVVLHGMNITVKSNSNGTWECDLPPQPAGGPYDIKISGKKDIIILKNILFGDVWLCSGQSNMEYQVGAFPWADDAVSKATNNTIRFLEIPNRIDEVPVNDLPSNIHWKKAGGADLKTLSATAYWFAANLQPEIKVPVGLIVSDWSGTAIEPWMPVKTIENFPQFKDVVNYLKKDPKSHAQIEKEFQSYLKSDWGPKYYYKDKGFDEKWYLESTGFTTWDSVRLPGWWENAGVGLEKHDGSVWFQTSFDLPENFKDSMFYLDLNLINDYDIIWVNGQKTGETFGDQNWRQYWVPARILRKKNNILVVRVFDMGGYGGLNFHPLWGNAILTGQWVCRKGISINPDTIPVPRIVNKSPYSYPTVLYNAMIHPVIHHPVTGVIWYQGESNAGRAKEYSDLFPALITSWREAFHKPDLPFLFVQLANFDPESEHPAESDWAELRESQEKTLSLPNTGMAVTIDIGEAANIHPANKMEVGRRLSLQALQKVYGMNVSCESPRYKNMSVSGDSVIIELETFGENLVIRDKHGYISGFEIASPGGQFHRAKAALRGNKVIVWNETVKKPEAVRYAWSKNPGPLNLYSTSGLPLAPFRTDSRKGITDDRVFDLNKIYF